MSFYESLEEKVGKNPLCGDELKPRLEKGDDVYCCKHFYLGEHCPYLRIKSVGNERFQSCSYKK